MLFQQYRMALNQEKYDSEVQNDDAIKRNQILFDFIKRTFNRLDGLYLCERCLLPARATLSLLLLPPLRPFFV